MARRPDPSHAVCVTLDIQPPRQWLDGGIPGFCDQVQWNDAWSQYAFASHVVQTFDPAGNRRSEEHLTHGWLLTSPRRKGQEAGARPLRTCLAAPGRFC